MIDRMVLMKAHVLLAVFILPVAILFFVTGALYTWGIKGDSDTVAQKIVLQQPLQEQLGSLVTVVEQAFRKQDIAVPSGSANLKKLGNSFQLEWTGASKDVVLEPTADPFIAELKIKNHSWHRHFVQLHKAKGGMVFKLYATLLAVVLLFLLVSGFMMAWQLPKFRKMTLISTGLGGVFFVLMLVVS